MTTSTNPAIIIIIVYLILTLRPINPRVTGISVFVNLIGLLIFAWK